jgi:hypothetical protein
MLALINNPQFLSNRFLDLPDRQVQDVEQLIHFLGCDSKRGRITPWRPAPVYCACARIGTRPWRRRLKQRADLERRRKGLRLDPDEFEADQPWASHVADGCVSGHRTAQPSMPVSRSPSWSPGRGTAASITTTAARYGVGVHGETALKGGPVLSRTAGCLLAILAASAVAGSHPGGDDVRRHFQCSAPQRPVRFQPSSCLR